MAGFLDLMQQGGWLMLPIGACSFIAVMVIVERILTLRYDNVIDDRIVAMLHDYEGAEHDEAVQIACRRSRGAFARLIEETLRTRHLEHAQAIETMHAVGRTQLGRLERGLTLLEIIAGISPLLGLLGTVIGMVKVFDAITAQGLGDPQVLSAGISQALVTTVAGLVVAIPALAFHSLLSKRVDDLATQMQNHATGFIVKLQSIRG